ncbi:hypothetical protein BC834DRAFT_580316 [Gloeopeniophorella convolvens]|nr:hypothetical protein BC834DRAFT_580316 [Gloeopeniophorella convolvens]
MDCPRSRLCSPRSTHLHARRHATQGSNISCLSLPSVSLSLYLYLFVPSSVLIPLSISFAVLSSPPRRVLFWSHLHSLVFLLYLVMCLYTCRLRRVTGRVSLTHDTTYPARASSFSLLLPSSRAPELQPPARAPGRAARLLPGRCTCDVLWWPLSAFARRVVLDDGRVG